MSSTPIPIADLSKQLSVHGFSAAVPFFFVMSEMPLSTHPSKDKISLGASIFDMQFPLGAKNSLTTDDKSTFLIIYFNVGTRTYFLDQK